jgi:hypothetical protein
VGLHEVVGVGDLALVEQRLDRRGLERLQFGFGVGPEVGGLPLVDGRDVVLDRLVGNAVVLAEVALGLSSRPQRVVSHTIGTLSSITTLGRK